MRSERQQPHLAAGLGRRVRIRARRAWLPGPAWALVVAAVGAVACVACAPAQAADWPIFNGPRQDGTSTETGLRLDWPEAGPPVVWRKPLGPSFSPPVVAKGRLIAFHRVANDEVVECVEARTAKRLWEFRYPTRYKDRYQYNGGPRSSPVIDGDRVVTYGAEGTLTCLDLATGRKVWQRALNKELEAPPEFFGVGTPPVIEGDVILLNPGAPGGAGVVGVDKRTGKTAWTTSGHGASYSAPVVRTVGGRRMAVFFTKDGLLVVAPETGKVLYEYPLRSLQYESVNAASPVVVGDVVFLSAAYNVGAIALRLATDGLEIVWQDREAMQNHWATSIHHEGHLYGVHGRHAREAEVRCVEWATGRVAWASPRGLGRLTAILAQGHLIAMAEGGQLVVIQANPERYVETRRTPMLEGPCYAPPVLANGLLYIRNETVMLCCDVRSAAE